MKDPSLIPRHVLDELKTVGLWDVHPRNLFRISWKNDPETGLFHGVNHFEVPRELTGVRARIVGLVGRFFPTGAHKVGASFGCLAPRLVTGRFDPTRQKAVWPSTGNYCRGGAFNGALLGCTSIAILPEQMSRERFEWLRSIGSEVIATPGCESNVKEIYDKCHELVATRGDEVVILNQFDEFGNGAWHYEVTASAIREVFEGMAGPRDRLAAYVSSTGSAGTIAAGDRLKEWFPGCRVAAAEALQCPTLLMNGFGAHRIEGIGDKHVPWIHDVRNTDIVVAVDDADPMALIRLFNEPAGREVLVRRGVPADAVSRLDLLGISGVGNLCAAIKCAKRLELDEHDVVFTIFTDSIGMYGSRLEEARAAEGPYDAVRAEVDLHAHLWGLKTDAMAELDTPGRRAVHNLKYYTWVEQQGKDVAELNAQWDDWRAYWPERFGRAAEYDRLIEAFNGRL
ncbi:MAG: pyridoxal-phosphate dependent enzyme [Deltaproteobacteria bacterium]|nr:pyridoxal-phosphate dependent enzyme [Deltaproteobacteria bacterium]